MNASLFPQVVAVDDAIDADFLTRLHQSVGPVVAVAAYMVHHGHDVRIPGMRVRPDRAQWSAYSDGGDLYVTGTNGQEYRVEVKSTTRAFGLGGEGWPFPDMLVCAEKDWDRADPKPHRYYLVNPAGTVAAIVRGDQMTPDRVRLQPDHRRGSVYPAYALPPDQLRFVRLR